MIGRYTGKVIESVLGKKAFSRQQTTFRTRPALEAVYQTIFMRDLARSGIEDVFYPVGSAANYSLLYLVLRIFRELGPSCVLDIGAGQTSILWSRLFGAAGAGRLLTVEHDPEWADHVCARVGHEILVSPLETRQVGEKPVRTYDWSAIRARGPFDVILCDGPHGTGKWSRYGIMSLVDETLPRDFVIVMDDAERDGEAQTVDAILGRLEAMGRPARLGKVRGQKAQAVIAGGAYQPAAFF